MPDLKESVILTTVQKADTNFLWYLNGGLNIGLKFRYSEEWNSEHFLNLDGKGLLFSNGVQFPKA